MTETTNYHIESPGAQTMQPTAALSLKASFEASSYLTYDPSKVKQYATDKDFER